jgi:hypothetical protein
MNMDQAMVTPSQQPGTSARGQMITSTPIYYDPRFYTLDRFYFPRTKEQQFSIWELYYNRDPAAGIGVDLYSALPWSEFDLLGMEDPKIKNFYESMFSELNLPAWLPDLTAEYLKMGCVIPHLILSGRKGYWTTCFAHNPNYVRVTPVPIPGADPLLDLKPSPDLRDFAVSRDPRVMQMRTLLPDVFVQRLMAGMPIPLDPINVTYLARRSAPYNVDGVSLYTRIFRIMMIEDFLTNANIAVAQRNAAPIRLFKLGDRDTGWLPEKEDEQALAEMLAATETDPMGAIIYHYGIEVEYIGVADRTWRLSQEWDFIERVKFLAMGISKSFLLGETSFAAAVAGLQTMAERLLALREKFENQWIYPKILRNVAKMNEMYHRKKAELDHRIRTTAKTDANLIIPKIKWRKALEPTQDASLLRVWQELMESGIASERTLATGSGLDLDTERMNKQEEVKYHEQMVKEHPELAPMSSRRRKGAKVDEKSNGRHRYHAPSSVLESKVWDKEGKYADIDYREIEPIAELLKNGESSDQNWKKVKPNWESVDEELQTMGYTDEQIARVAEVMNEEGVKIDDAGVRQGLNDLEKKIASEEQKHEPMFKGKYLLAGRDPAKPDFVKDIEDKR